MAQVPSARDAGTDAAALGWVPAAPPIAPAAPSPVGGIQPPAANAGPLSIGAAAAAAALWAPLPQMQMEAGGGAGPRPYRCRGCGALKRGHICPLNPPPSIEAPMFEPPEVTVIEGIEFRACMSARSFQAIQRQHTPTIRYRCKHCGQLKKGHTCPAKAAAGPPPLASAGGGPTRAEVLSLPPLGADLAAVAAKRALSRIEQLGVPDAADGVDEVVHATALADDAEEVEGLEVIEVEQVELLSLIQI